MPTYIRVYSFIGDNLTEHPFFSYSTSVAKNLMYSATSIRLGEEFQRETRIAIPYNIRTDQP